MHPIQVFSIAKKAQNFKNTEANNVNYIIANIKITWADFSTNTRPT